MYSFSRAVHPEIQNMPSLSISIAPISDTTSPVNQLITTTTRMPKSLPLSHEKGGEKKGGRRKKGKKEKKADQLTE
jgi:hypothetical protein